MTNLSRLTEWNIIQPGWVYRTQVSEENLQTKN